MGVLKKIIIEPHATVPDAFWVRDRFSGAAASFQKTSGPEGIELTLVWTPPHKRKRGLGTRILKAAIKAIQAKYGPNWPIYLLASPAGDCTMSDGQLENWYRKVGFCPIKRGPLGVIMIYAANELEREYLERLSNK